MLRKLLKHSVGFREALILNTLLLDQQQLLIFFVRTKLYIMIQRAYRPIHFQYLLSDSGSGAHLGSSEVIFAFF